MRKRHDAINHKIRLLRTEKQLTLRQLAERTGVSHSTINRIEQGIVEPSESALLALEKALGFHHVTHREDVERYNHHRLRLYRHIIYVNYEAAQAALDALLAHRKTYESSDCFIDFYLMMFMAVTHLRVHLDWHDELYRKLTVLSKAFNRPQQSLFLLESGIYWSFFKDNRHRGKEAVEAHFAITTSENERAIGEYTLGAMNLNDYRCFKRGVMYLDAAQQRFQSHNNFVRVMMTKAMKQILYIYMNRFDAFVELNKQTRYFSEIKGIEIIYRSSMKSLARYYLVRGEYKAAADTLDRFLDANEADYYLLKGYALFRLERFVEALAVIREAREASLYDAHDLSASGLSAMEKRITQGSTDEALLAMQAYLDKAFEVRDYMSIRLGFKMIAPELEAWRQYKALHQYADRLLEAVKNIVGKDEAHETRSTRTDVSNDHASRAD